MHRIVRYLVVAALQWEARLVLRKYKPRIVGITGSVGKTSVKDAVFTVLSSSFFVRKSEKSFNSEIGVPLTVLGRPSGWGNPILWTQNLIEGLALILLKNHYPKWLVLEVGADRPGDIKEITTWLKPDVAVLTRLPDVPVHVEFFDSPEGVAREKAHLVAALGPDGTLVYNADDERVAAIAERFSGKKIGYGLERGNLRASGDELFYEEGRLAGMTFRIEEGTRSIPLTLRGSAGRQSAYTALAALAVGMSQGVNLVSGAAALSAHEPAPGRMRLLAGRDGMLIIDDSYNASPVATTEALTTLGRIETQGKKIAVIGDMLELGQYTVEEHRKAGALAAEAADMLVTVGLRAKAAAEGAHKAGMYKRNIIECRDAQEAIEKLEKHLEPGAVVLVKGSQGMRLERVVASLLAHLEDASKLLVRQDKEWQTR